MSIRSRAGGEHGVRQFDLERLKSYVEADQVGMLVGGQPAQGAADLVKRSDPGVHRAVLRHGLLRRDSARDEFGRQPVQPVQAPRPGPG